ncbi:MAG TPA: hypothetical protein VK541_12525, partial [Pedobacter sp.]|uniref:hypothetical protein n=1 Tax=Pedobacter sp. TaxID=1411316 RepID=UPI002C40AF0F
MNDKKLRLTKILTLCLLCFTGGVVNAQKTIWQIGNADNKADGMALAPSGYQHFLEQDFGWEDKFYLIGVSKPDRNWSYIL